MNWREEPVVFACADDTLVGVLARVHEPDAQASDTAVVIVTGGPQYRAGSHRQFVQLARALAEAGYPVLRFDVRGMGDSSGAQRSFEQLDDDIAAAINALQATLPGARRVVLWGLCDGASAALLYWHRTHDRRVVGLCLLNPWVRSAISLAKAQVKHYYRQRLMQREFWLKLIRGKVARRALTELLANLRTALRPRPGGDAARGPTAFQHDMATGWRTFDGPILLVLSENDYTAKEFLEYIASEPPWRGCLDRAGVTRIDLSGADHTFSADPSRLSLQQGTVSWLEQAMHRQRRVPDRAAQDR